MTIARTHNITKKFGTLTAVNEVSIPQETGEFLGLVGANGAGKTTLIKILCGLIKPNSGTFFVQGRIGYMCQTFSLVEELTVHENTRFYSALYGMAKSHAEQAERALLEELHLLNYRDRQVRHLPLGWRQALSFAIATIHKPAVLILDEPTSGLDALSRRRIWRMMQRRAAEGTGILVSTHYLDEAYYCNRIAIMQEGRVTEAGKPEAIARTAAELSEHLGKHA